MKVIIGFMHSTVLNTTLNDNSSFRTSYYAIVTDRHVVPVT